MAEKRKLIVIDPVGLYASPVTDLVNEVRKFQSYATLKYEEKEVNLKSMMGVLSLGIPTKATIEICFDGVDEKMAVETIIDYLSDQKVAMIQS